MGLFTVLNHVSITVTDLAKAVDFYEGVLGLARVPRPAFDFPGMWYSLGGELTLHIIVNEGLVRPPVERERFQIRYPHFALWTDDADTSLRQLEGAGVPVHDFVSTPTGLRQLFLKDPDGNMVELIGPTREHRARRME